jgi:hypothetical protein
MSDFFRYFKTARGAQVAILSKFANIAASSTDGDLGIPAVDGKRVVVLSCAFVAGGTATNATFNSKPSGSAGSAISMLFANAANGGAVLGFSPHGWMMTKTGEGLSLTTGTGSTTGVQIVYAYVDP